MLFFVNVNVFKCYFTVKNWLFSRVIGQSLKNFKAFFHWLYSCLLKFHDKPMDETPQVQYNIIVHMDLFKCVVHTSTSLHASKQQVVCPLWPPEGCHLQLPYCRYEGYHIAVVRFFVIMHKGAF